MQSALDWEAVGLFLVLVLPGLVSIYLYRLLMPARSMEWGSAILQGMFYSSMNFALLFPIIYLVLLEPRSWWQYWGGVVIVLFLGPALWPFALRAFFKWKWLGRRIQIPYPTVWDYFFSLRQPVFALVHLTDGNLIGGLWGEDSYAGSFPNDGDIYLEAVYLLDEEGHFGAPIADTRGVLLRKDQYSYVELFALPEAEGETDGEG